MSLRKQRFEAHEHNYQCGRVKVALGDIVVDAGATFGAFTNKVLNVASKIIAIEPNPDNIPQLKLNFEDDDKVIVVAKGLWSCKGEMFFAKSNAATDGHLIMASHPHKLEQTVMVDVDSLDNICKDLGITRIDYLKADIEGAELEAVKGMKNVQPRKMAIAAYHDHTRKSINEIERILKGREYQVEVVGHDFMIYAWR